MIHDLSPMRGEGGGGDERRRRRGWGREGGEEAEMEGHGRVMDE